VNVFLYDFYSIRLSVRTSGFQPGKRGSTPLPSTNFALVSLVVEVRFCNPGVAVRFCPGAPSLNERAAAKRVLNRPVELPGVSTIIGGAAVMVWQGIVNPPLFGASRFDPYHLHQILFQSSTAVVQLTVNQLVAGSIPASGAKTMMGRSVVRLAPQTLTLLGWVQIPTPLPVTLPDMRSIIG
jgi:hypothetical protein